MYGSQTPMYGSGSRTPMYGSQTPLQDGECAQGMGLRGDIGVGLETGDNRQTHFSHSPISGSRTPHYGSQTPLHDGSRTPAQSGAWDPNNPNTPSR